MKSENSPTQEPPRQGKKRDLKAWPIEAFCSVNPLVLSQLADSLALSSQSGWLPDQLLHHFGQWQLVRNAQGLIDPLATARINLGSDFDRGCWILACRLPRSKLIPKQTAQPGFCSFVPLILAGIKRYQGIAYSEWSREGLEAVMPKDLHEACVTQWPEIPHSELLELRQQWLLVRSGPKEGTLRDPKSSWKLYGLQDTPLGALPNYTQVQIAQIWTCHPDLRHQDMICNPLDWDQHPEPLIKTEPIARWTASSGLPWEL